MATLAVLERRYDAIKQRLRPCPKKYRSLREFDQDAAELTTDIFSSPQHMGILVIDKSDITPSDTAELTCVGRDVINISNSPTEHEVATPVDVSLTCEMKASGDTCPRDTTQVTQPSLELMEEFHRRLKVDRARLAQELSRERVLGGHGGLGLGGIRQGLKGIKLKKTKPKTS